MTNENFERSLEHEDALYGSKIAARRSRMLEPISVQVEYFHFVRKIKDCRWRTG